MVRHGLFLIGTAALLSLGTTGAIARSGGGIMLGNVDVRALQPPVDLRRKQLEAQDPQLYDRRFLGQGRSVGYRDPYHDRQLDR